MTASVATASEEKKPAPKERPRSPISGHPVPNGRPKGVPNKLTQSLRAAIEYAAQPGQCHPQGLAGWLVERARGSIGDRQIFAGLVGKVIPLQVNQQVSGGIAIQLGWLQQRGIGAVAAQSAERVPQVLEHADKAATANLIANQLDDRTIVLSPVLPDAVAVGPASQDGQGALQDASGADKPAGTGR
jgi:hypothetical protein